MEKCRSLYLGLRLRFLSCAFPVRRIALLLGAPRMRGHRKYEIALTSRFPAMWVAVVVVVGAVWWWGGGGFGVFHIYANIPLCYRGEFAREMRKCIYLPSLRGGSLLIRAKLPKYAMGSNTAEYLARVHIIWLGMSCRRHIAVGKSAKFRNPDIINPYFRYTSNLSILDKDSEIQRVYFVFRKCIIRVNFQPRVYSYYIPDWD